MCSYYCDSRDLVTVARERQMPVTQPDHAGQVTAALRTIVADHGLEALSNVQLMAGLMSDLLPDAPREAQVLRAAAEHKLADALRDHVTSGMDIGMATGLVASSFAARTMFAPEICRWVVDELVAAMGVGAESVSGDLPGTEVLLPVTRPAVPSVSRSARIRPALTVASVCAVIVAVVTVLVIVAEGGNSGRSPSPGHRPAAARYPRHAVVPDSTQVVIYEPWSSAGLARGISAHATLHGQCYVTSLTSGRDDAFRCIVGNSLFDPCFSDPYPVSQPGQVACPYPSLTSVTIIDLTAPLPSFSGDQTSTPTPWLVVLTNGQQCFSTSGSAGIQVGGLNDTFACGARSTLFGQPHFSRMWTIYRQAKGQTNLTPVTIAKAYE